MDFSKTENEKLDLNYFHWLGYKNVNGALKKEGFEGEIQFVAGCFYYCNNNEAIKKLEIKKDINDIYLKLKYPKSL